MKKKLFIPLVACLMPVFASGQSPVIDSLKNIVQTTKLDTVKVIALNKLCLEYEFADVETAKNYLNEAGKLANKIKFHSGIINNLVYHGYLEEDAGKFTAALAYYKQAYQKASQYKLPLLKALSLTNIGTACHFSGQYDSSIYFFNRSLSIYNSILKTAAGESKREAKKGIATNYTNIGIAHQDKGKFSKALVFFFDALKINEELFATSNKTQKLVLKKSLATTYGNIATTYAFNNEPGKALTYFFKALKIDEESGSKMLVSRTLSNIGNVYRSMGKNRLALSYYMRALELVNEMGNKPVIATLNANIGLIYNDIGDSLLAAGNKRKSADSAYWLGLGNHLEAYAVNKELGLQKEIALAGGNIGIVYMKLKRYNDAEKYFLESLEISKIIGAGNVRKNQYHYLSGLYKEKGSWQKAYLYYEAYIALRDSIFNEENTKEITRKELNFKYEKKAAADSVRAVEEKKVIAAQLEHEQTQKYALYGGLVLFFVFGLFMYNRFRVTTRQKKIIQQQKHEVDEKQKEIIDSINYARRIQQALMPTDKNIDKTFKKLRGKQG